MPPFLFLLLLLVDLLSWRAVEVWFLDQGAEAVGRLGALWAGTVKPVGFKRKAGVWFLQCGEKGLFLRALLFEGST